MKNSYIVRLTASLMVFIMLFSSLGNSFAVYANEAKEVSNDVNTTSKAEEETDNIISSKEIIENDQEIVDESNSQKEEVIPENIENTENKFDNVNSQADYNNSDENIDKDFDVEKTDTESNADEEKQSSKDIEDKNIEEKDIEESSLKATSVDTTKDFYYLSDIPYVRQGSYSGYNGFQMDNSPSGKKIELFVDGERRIFDKGIGAHATSCIIYDISEYSETFDKFTAYLGLDARQGGAGDGIKFTISVSDDKRDWQDIYKTDVLKGNSESVFVDLDIKGRKFIKLFAHDNGANGNDHAVYADARLKKKDYNVNQESKGPFKRISEYDKILAEKSIEENIKNNIDIVYKREFVSRIGYYTLNNLYENAEYREAIDYLCEEKPMSYFINGGALIRDGGTYPEKTIIAFAQIYNKHKDKLKDASENDFYLRLAISVASAYNYPANVRFWMDNKKEENPVQRFETYIALSAPGGVMDNAGKTTNWSGKQFRELPVAMMRWVVDARMNEDEFYWLADYALHTRDTIDKGPQKFLDAYTYIEYKGTFKYNDERYYSTQNHEMWNKKYNFDKYFSDYGTKVHRLWIVFEEGAVCGGLAKTYANLAEVFGRPSVVVGQPGHAATITWDYDSNNKRYMWRIQNDISGWPISHSEFNNYLLNWGSGKSEPASYIPMASDAINDSQNFEKAYAYTLLATSYPNIREKETLYRKALEVQSFNLDAWEGLVKTKLQDTSLKSSDYLNLAKEIMAKLAYYPLPMENLLNSIKGKITDVKDTAEFDLLRLQTLQNATKATVDNVYQPNVSISMAQFLLKQGADHLASFSFDGEDAGKIVLNKKYDDSSIRVRYSIDGGNEWKQTDEHKITLTDEEMNSLSVDKDIKVGLVGVNNIYTIDLTSSKSPKQDNLYQNDYENLFITSSPHLEYSTDNGVNWKDYEPGLNSTTRFIGNQDVLLRYKSHGTVMKSQEDKYTFSEDNNTPERTYYPLKNVKLESFSSEQDKGKTAAKNLIDGSLNTHWHSKYNIVDKKEYVVSFEQPVYISALEYFPHGPNGRWKDIVVSSSMDNKTWETVGEAHFENNEAIKSISLNTTKPIKYLKINGLNSWGKSQPEYDKYFSGKMLNFYVDTTKNIVPDAVISYSTSDKTNKDVVATITLPESCVMEEGMTSHTFTENGEHIFKYKDKYNNKYTAVAKVDWIRKAVLTASVSYSTTQPTHNDVVATVGNFNYDDVYVSNNEQSLSHTFTDNGEFLFELADPYGNTGSVKATVNNIQKENNGGSNSENNSDKVPQQKPETTPDAQQNSTSSKNEKHNGKSDLSSSNKKEQNSSVKDENTDKKTDTNSEPEISKDTSAGLTDDNSNKENQIKDAETENVGISRGTVVALIISGLCIALIAIYLMKKNNIFVSSKTKNNKDK